MFDPTNQYELSLLINGNPVTEYQHNGNMFVEGRTNSTYELRVRNNSPERIMAIMSVDGLGVIDGEQAGSESAGYIVDPYGTLTVPGWKVDGDTAAKFQFGSASGSYSNRTGRGKKNVGVVGLMVFREALALNPFNIVKYYSGNAAPSTSFSWTDQSSSGSTQNINGNFSTSNSMSIGSGLDADMIDGMNARSLLGGAISANSVAMAAPSGAIQKSVTQSLGTEYGDATKFETETVTFNKRDPNYPDALLSIFYDDANGLEARGIVLPYRNSSPQAFPTYNNTTKYASPPPGWRK